MIGEFKAERRKGDLLEGIQRAAVPKKNVETLGAAQLSASDNPELDSIIEYNALGFIWLFLSPGSVR